MLLKDKNAVITGARKGIGKSIVEMFAKNGANIWACFRTQDAQYEAWAKTLEQSCGVWIKLLRFDLNDSTAMKMAVRQISAERKTVDILVNNAGMISERSSFSMTPVSKMKELFNINFFAQMEFTQYISRIMTRTKSGSVINMASISGMDIIPEQFEYVSSKAAMIGATRKLALELGEFGIRVNAVAPGLINTEMSRTSDEETVQNIINQSIMQRYGTAEEVAGVALFLASDLSSYITGQIIRVDGGIA
ncbi:MAG: SDR family oxidoreductase [Synergistaceae bacterium]|jgi:3-oxoacyl-[acyl-carrier protein] reductase|nr:SDR family oxidoreductase [Synergistaceae bacterium]